MTAHSCATYTDPYGGAPHMMWAPTHPSAPTEDVKLPRNGGTSQLRIGGHRLWKPTSAVDFCGVLLTGPPLPGAACAGTDAHLWDDRLDQTPPESPTARDQRHQLAIETCQKCPVRAECLQKRLNDPTLGKGVFGGQVFDSDPHVRKCPCGQPLPEGSSPQRKWCSEKCWKATQKAPVVQRCCDHCGGQFTTNQTRQRFCTRPCRDRYRGSRTTRPHLPGLANCQVCDTPIPPAQTAIGRRNCSTNCRKRAAERRQQVAA